MRRPGYREAVLWLAQNDDCYWLGDSNPCPSVSTAMVSDLFGVEEARLIKDLRAALQKVYPRHEVFRAKAEAA
jgi:hypothetical protein